jgi:hypothetical protein
MDKVFYNKSSADSLGWTPEWFNVEYFDENLVKAIRAWQKENGLTADGLCGPGTFRRIFTEREDKIHNYMPQIFSNQELPEHGTKQKHIVHNGNFFEIDWPMVTLWSEQDGFEAKHGTYYDYTGKPDRKPTFFVNHWDVCLSSESCHKVLKNRGISVHFLIDNDGRIFQTMDTQHGAWHAGGSKWNHKSIGVEISNAYYTKYQDWYVRNDFGERPIIDDAYVHGSKLSEHLGFYDVQKQALIALWAAIHKATNIPIEVPTNDNGSLVEAVDSKVSRGTFKGFVNHYNLTRRKIDCAGLDLIKIRDDAKKK